MSGWKESVRAGSDLAMIGFAVLLAALPVVTAGAALAAGSAAVHHWCEHGTLPSARLAGRWYVRALLPGLSATLVAAVVGVALVLDLRALVAGHVPGGGVAVAVTALVAGYAAGTAALTIVFVGRGQAWIAGLGAAVRMPTAALALSVVVAIAAVLVVSLPATTPLVLAFALFAGHVTVRRLKSARAPGRRI
jgi:hypothetical protein